jgi:uncharacterized protein YabE (DUF348 family)
MVEHNFTENTELTASNETVETVETAAATPRGIFTSTALRRRLPLIAGATVFALAITGGSIAYANMHKTVTLDVDGQTRTVSTFASTVDGLLTKQGITIGEHDTVTPATGTSLTEGSDIVVRYGHELTLNVDGDQQSVWVPSLDAADALGALAQRGSDVSLVASRSSDRTTLGVRLDIDGPVAVEADGTTTMVGSGRGGIDTVLAKAGVELGDQDTIEVVSSARYPEAANDGADVAVLVHRVSTQDITSTQAVAFPTEERADANLYVGSSKVIQAGRDGERTIVERVTTVDGVETARETISDNVTSEPVTRIVAKGTKAKPKPAPSAPGGGAVVGGDVWARLAQCESGGRPNAVSANGLYHGLYQFSVGTWRSLGGQGLPSQASPAEQTMRAQQLQARSGWGQWPACARKLGLL